MPSELAWNQALLPGGGQAQLGRASNGNQEPCPHPPAGTPGSLLERPGGLPQAHGEEATLHGQKLAAGQAGWLWALELRPGPSLL